MNETKKLYDIDAYATKFEARVLACEKVINREEIRYQVVLNQTLFFPEEGGQSPDQGELDGCKVLDVQIKKGIIYHTLNQHLSEGTKVCGSIDWNHRFSNMQQHSGEHIFSGLVHSLYGFDNVGFHLSDQVVTMDFNGVLTANQAREIEERANEVIAQNLFVQVSFPMKEELQTMNYRSKIEIQGQVRIVTIPGVDVCACCAPHVKQTGEIGLLKIMNLQNYKGGVRISILCGKRALKDFQQKNTVLQELSSLLSANQENLATAVTRLKDSNQNLKLELTAVKQQQLETKINEIEKEREHVILFEEYLDTMIVRNAVNKMILQHNGYCGIFSKAEDGIGYQFILASKEQDCKLIMTKLKETLNARGGGSSSMVQGSVTATRDEILSAISLNR